MLTCLPGPNMYTLKERLNFMLQEGNFQSGMLFLQDEHRKGR